MLRRALSVVAVVSLAALSACTRGSHAAPPSSSAQPAYAAGYADSVSTTTKAIVDRQAEVKQLTGTFGGRVDELKKPNWQRVETIVDKADASGKSAGYAEAEQEWAAVKRFFTEEQATIGGKVAGNAQYAAKQAGCTADVGGPAAFALKDAVDKQLEKRVRARNDAFVVLDRYGTSLGKENTAVLEKLADDVALASYIVNVDLVEQRERLRSRLSEKDTIKKTLDGVIEDERAFQAEPGRTDAEKKASEDRIAAATKNRAEVDKAGSSGDELMKSVDEQIDGAKKQYEDAFKALKAKIEDKAKAEKT